MKTVIARVLRMSACFMTAKNRMPHGFARPAVGRANHGFWIGIITLLFACTLPLTAQDSCPMHVKHTASSARHRAEVENHGDEAMGFPHDKTTHHFRLYSDGGAIEVTANDSHDSANTEAIRSHLKQIITMFSNGDFSTPMFIHSQTPPGVPVMKQRRTAISYVFEELPAGGCIRIKTADQEALKAVQDFLRFQIDDHHTGDPQDK